MGYLCEEVPIYGVSRDAYVDHVAYEYLAFIKRPPVEVVPDSRAKVEEDRMKWVLVGGAEISNDPLTLVPELVACHSPSTVCLFHGVGFIVLDASGPRVHESAMGGGHPAFPRE